MITAIECNRKLFATLPEARKEAINTESDINLIGIEMNRTGEMEANHYITLFVIHPVSERLEKKHTIKRAKQLLKTFYK